jgi:hypothetical protein
MATHTDEDLEYALNTLETLGKEFGIIGKRGRRQKLAVLATPHFGVPRVGLVQAKRPYGRLKAS